MLLWSAGLTDLTLQVITIVVRLLVIQPPAKPCRLGWKQPRWAVGTEVCPLALHRGFGQASSASCSWALWISSPKLPCDLARYRTLQVQSARVRSRLARTSPLCACTPLTRVPTAAMTTRRMIRRWSACGNLMRRLTRGSRLMLPCPHSRRQRRLRRAPTSRIALMCSPSQRRRC